MSCCGCASRVLKLQSELRSWKTKLGNEKREKKMIMKWILTVFGYDVRVDIDRPNRGIRLEANENKEATSKALLKLVGVGGNEGSDFGVMVMEVKLEDHEFFEPFEEPHDVPEFPILEINSMPTNTQAPPPILNTGLNPLTFGHLTQPLSQVPSLGISTPMEIAAAAPLPNNSVVGDQEVVYLAGDFEAGATLEVPNNGQSFIIVRTNENEDISSTIPMQMDYATTGLVSEDIITDDGSGNLVFGSGVSVNAGMNFLPTINPKQISNISMAPAVQLSPAAPVPVPMPIQISFQQNLPPVILDSSQTIAPTPVPPPPIYVANVKPPTKKKTNKSLSSQQPLSIPTIPSSTASSKTNSKKKKQNAPTSSSSGNDLLRFKSVSGASKMPSPTVKTKSSTSTSNKQQQNISLHMQYQEQVLEDPNKSARAETVTSQRKDSSSSSCEFGLTLREKAEMYVIQKAKEAVEKVNPNGFRCLVCEENRYTYFNYDSAVAHAKSHFDAKPYKCESCDEVFQIQRELLTHKKTAHPKPKGPNVNVNASSISGVPPNPVSLSRLTQGQCQSSPSSFTKSSGTVQSSTIIASPNSMISTAIPSTPGKTIVVQSPFDKNSIRGINISSDMLAAIFSGSLPNNQIVLTQVSNCNSDVNFSVGGAGNPIIMSSPSSSSSLGGGGGITDKLNNGIEGANASAAFAQNASFVIKNE